MIGNFFIVSGSTTPWLECTITKDGIVPIYSQAAAYGCGASGETDPNILDLQKVTGVEFQMFRCGRVPQNIALQGVAEKLQRTVTEGTGDAAMSRQEDVGRVRYKWHPDDTSEPELYYGRFILTFEDNSKLKWPYQLESLAIEVQP